MANNVDDSAYIEGAEKRRTAMIVHASIDAAIQVALALWTRKGKLGIADMQNEIANRNMKLAEQIRDHVKKFWPYEKAAVDDAFGLARQTPQYDALALTWSAYADDSHTAYLSKFEDLLNDHCIFLTPCERANWYRNQQKDRAQCMYYADRVAENRADALNDMRYAHQYAVLGLGRGHLGNTLSFNAASAVSGNGARQGLLGAIGMAIGEYETWRGRPDTPEQPTDTTKQIDTMDYSSGGDVPSTSQGITSGRDMGSASELTKLRSVEGGGTWVRGAAGHDYIMDSSGELFTPTQWEARQERMFAKTGDRSFL